MIVSDSDKDPIWINQALGERIWKKVQTLHGRAYSREVRDRKLRFAMLLL